MDKSLCATLIGAVIALIGVVFTLRANQKIFEANLKEERDKIARDKEYNAKHKALIAASEALTSYLQFYITLPDRHLSGNGEIPEEVRSVSVSLSALHFFCGIDTIRKTTVVSQTMAYSFFEALKIKLQGDFLSEDIKSYDHMIADIKKSNRLLEKEMLTMVESNPSNITLAAHRKQYSDNINQIELFNNKKCELVKQRYGITEKCRDVIMNNLPKIYEGLQEVLLLARQELGFPIDAEEYSAIISEATATALSLTNNMLREIRAQVLLKIE